VISARRSSRWGIGYASCPNDLGKVLVLVLGTAEASGTMVSLAKPQTLVRGPASAALSGQTLPNEDSFT
jgi:hypothetical protein